MHSCPSFGFHLISFCYSEVMFWPVFIIATLASVVGSQAIISATFSIVSQCRALRCFPRVKIKHTSNQIHGQIYIPEVNWMLMMSCLAVVIGFRDTRMIGNAYGLYSLSLSLSVQFCISEISIFTPCCMFRACWSDSDVHHNLLNVFNY